MKKVRLKENISFVFFFSPKALSTKGKVETRAVRERNRERGKEMNRVVMREFVSCQLDCCVFVF